MRSSTGEAPVFRCGELTADLVRRHVAIKGREVKLSAKEYDLLRLLVMRAAKALAHRFVRNALSTLGLVAFPAANRCPLCREML